MKSLAIDFTNKSLCIMNNGQEGTQYCDVSKDALLKFIPERYRNYTSFTWNFENETLSMNQEYKLSENAIKRGAIITKDCFIPECIVPMPGLSSHYNEFLEILDLEEISGKDLLSELSPYLRKLLGW